MNREIKYRQPLFVNGVFKKWHYWGHLGCGSFISPAFEDRERESQQYTGLTDKNGVGIYEGDVILIADGVDRGDGTFDDEILEVKYEDCCFFGVADNSKEYLCYIEEQEVIGNITENPSLLE